MMSTVFCHKRT